MITAETMKGLYLRPLSRRETLCELCERPADQLIIHHMGTSTNMFSRRCEYHRLITYDTSESKDFIGTPQEWDELAALRQVHDS